MGILGIRSDINKWVYRLVREEENVFYKIIEVVKLKL